VVAVLVTIRQTVHVRVVDEGVVAVSPGEPLAPDSEVVVGHEGRGLGLLAHTEGVDMAEDNDGNSAQNERLLPDPETTSMPPTHLPGGLPPSGGLQKLRVGPSESCLTFKR